MTSKGITPVIATVMLITISIAATGTAYTFIMNAQETAKDSYEDRFTQREIERKTDINLEHIYEDSNGDAILIIRNTGSLTQIVEEDDTKFWTLYVDGEPVGPSDSGTAWTYVQSSYNSDSNVELNPQATMAINSTTSFPVSTQVEYKIVGKYGSQDTMFCGPSSTGTC